ncbi:hypothetical protein C8046_16885 [Serinibacter arcticus]|uniref:Uncharacterized protein n=1 Tax=Serinibacter arcticus TaxID=1655435 RepID=A0A2U1ZYS2_9MICO|nr:hypothetical protein [Serinibacter arcticus]PWD52073.1 hypothetical protein C8046_16885 [Serinibacter arcticus]
MTLSVLAGFGLGLLSAVVLLRPLDLQPFTQGAGQPPLAADPVALGGVAAAALGVAVVLSLVTTVRRTAAPTSEED